MEDFDCLVQLIEEKAGSRHYFIETGTGTGETCQWAAGQFRDVITIEIMDDLYHGNFLNFWDKGLSNIKLIHGTAENWVRDIVYRIDGPAVWWLDAHDVNRLDGIKPPSETSVREELNEILPDGRDHLVLIDDARLFGGGGYPSLNWVRSIAEKNKYQFELVGDIIVLERP